MLQLLQSLPSRKYLVSQALIQGCWSRLLSCLWRKEPWCLREERMPRAKALQETAVLTPPMGWLDHHHFQVAVHRLLLRCDLGEEGKQIQRCYAAVKGNYVSTGAWKRLKSRWPAWETRKEMRSTWHVFPGLWGAVSSQVSLVFM